MIRTPQKNREVDCFVTVKMLLHGRKLLSENFKDKLVSLFERSETHDKLLHDAAVCRNCYSQVLKTVTFIQKLRRASDTFLSSSTSIKRCASSPITPKSVVHSRLGITRPVQSSWKQLKLSKSYLCR
jgi:hypothetical protein